MKLVVFFILPFFVFAQNNTKIDSLESIVNHTTNDSILMDTYNKLRRATFFKNPKKAKEYTFLLLKTAKKRNDSLHIAFANFYLGNSFVKESNYEKALKYYFKAANYFEHVKDTSRLSSMYNGIGVAYENNGIDSLSLKYFKKSQKLSSSIGDLRRSALALNNIGNIYKNRNELEIAKKYMEKAVKEFNTTKQFQYINLASLNLANLYIDLKEYKKADSLYNKVLITIDSIKDIRQYASLLRGLGNLKIAKNERAEGLKLLKQAYHKYTTSNFFDDSYNMMPDLLNAYEMNKKFEAGFYHYKIFTATKDSIFTSEKDKNLTDALQKYETEKKDAQLKVLTLETEKANQQKKMYLFFAFSGILFSVLISVFFYKNKKKNAVLAQQKQMLEKTLGEKNILLRETHHRVKNSFQMVSSLLYLQSENVADKEAKRAIKEAQNRVRSMVLIHHKLYNKKQLVGIDTKEYIEDLTKDIFESHLSQTIHLTYKLKVESMILSVDTITPIGLILNELIINALKHAFDVNTKEGLLQITFFKKEEQLILQVVDNGKGFIENDKEYSFGLKLIRALASQLEASFKINSDIGKGTEVILTITDFEIVT